ncbi:hypothetical protein [Rufibacter soli]
MKHLFLCLLLCLLSLACRTARPTEPLIIPPAEYHGTIGLAVDTLADNAVVDSLLIKLDTLSAPTKAVIRHEVKKALATRPRLTKPILLDTLGMKVELRQVGDSLRLSMIREPYTVQVPTWPEPAPEKSWPVDKWYFWLFGSLGLVSLAVIVNSAIRLFQR